MSAPAIPALQAEIIRARELMASLSPAEWATASGCTGWSVQDVVCHMASVFHSIADPSTIEGGTSPDVERNAEVPVQARRAWSTAQVVAEYEEWAEKGVAALTAMQSPPMADTVIALANLGSHPMHILGNAIVFDHYCHLRHDIGHAIVRAADMPHDADALAATLEWMLAGLPQMCTPALSACTQGVNLSFEGPAAGDYTLAPGTPFWTVTPGRDSSLPTAITSAHSFVSWATKRADWRDSVTVEGDLATAAPTLDALNII
jgi:uncharacterized protein (TIGR03083 family)